MTEGNDTPRVEVQAFARAMERELRVHANKGLWTSCDPEYLLDRLYEELAELEHALLVGAPLETVESEAADVGNFAMMIVDVLQKRSAGAAVPRQSFLDAPSMRPPHLPRTKLDEARETLARVREVADDPELDPDTRAALQFALEGKERVLVLEQTGVEVVDMGAIGGEFDRK